MTSITRIIRHYIEMVLAMLAGMLVLGLPIALVLDPQSVRRDEYSRHAHHLAVAA